MALKSLTHHYEEAERLLNEAETPGLSNERILALAAMAQVHATLSNRIQH